MLINSFPGWFWHMVYKIRSTFYKTSAIRYKRMNCVSGYILNSKKRILNDCRSRIRFHLHTARCRYGYRSILRCERPPAPDHHPSVPRRSIHSARDEWFNHYQQSMCSCFPFFIFLIKHIVSIDFLLSIYTSSHYIYRNMNPFMSIFEIQSIFFSIYVLSILIHVYFIFGKQVNARQMVISSHQ